MRCKRYIRIGVIASNSEGARLPQSINGNPWSRRGRWRRNLFTPTCDGREGGPGTQSETASRITCAGMFELSEQRSIRPNSSPSEDRRPECDPLLAKIAATKRGSPSVTVVVRGRASTYRTERRDPMPSGRTNAMRVMRFRELKATSWTNQGRLLVGVDVARAEHVVHLRRAYTRVVVPTLTIPNSAKQSAPAVWRLVVIQLPSDTEPLRLALRKVLYSRFTPASASRQAAARGEICPGGKKIIGCSDRGHDLSGIRWRCRDPKGMPHPTPAPPPPPAPAKKPCPSRGTS
jgi:hypothetical protein